MEKDPKRSTKPTVSEGVEQPESINANLSSISRKKKLPNAEDLFSELAAGNRMALGRAITIIESKRRDYLPLARELVNLALQEKSSSFRIGVTGTPGVGKSTFIESFGMHLLSLGKKVAVLAVDPSSQVSKGSILGDKTRMTRLSSEENAFIRPSAAGRSLGGVARKTRETILLCEAAGYDYVLIETVGVGQSETMVHQMVDFFLLLLQPGAGDELQGIKRGIVEMADCIAVNKADGNNLDKAKQAKQQYKNALHLFPVKENGWNPKTTLISGLQASGLEDLLEILEGYKSEMGESGYWQSHRKEQDAAWMMRAVEDGLLDRFHGSEEIKDLLSGMQDAVASGRVSSYEAAQRLLEVFFRGEGG